MALDDTDLAAIEQLALELARLAGAEITATLGSEITVEYKGAAKGEREPTNPVSEVDRAVERRIRELVAERFPTHGIVGEEIEVHPDPSHEFVWVVDPVDGTTNFVNGFPLFAAAVGVLHRGVPVAGAIWCSTSHELLPGVYHARRGGPLRFEEREVPQGRPSTGVRRRLLAAPGGAPGRMSRWDTRVTGSAALECAFVAAGIFVGGAFWAPSVWDVAAGVALVQASGQQVWIRADSDWHPFERFEAPARVREQRTPTLRAWHQPLAIGLPEALEAMRQRARGPRWAMRLRFRMARWLAGVGR